MESLQLDLILDALAPKVTRLVKSINAYDMQQINFEKAADKSFLPLFNDQTFKITDICNNLIEYAIPQFHSNLERVIPSLYDISEDFSPVSDWTEDVLEKAVCFI